MSTSAFVCVSVCLSANISPEPRDLYQFSVHVAYGRTWLDPAPAGLRNPKEKGEFWGLSGPFKSIANLGCSRRCRVRRKKDHSIADNVIQQKGSFNMPGKRK